MAIPISHLEYREEKRFACLRMTQKSFPHKNKNRTRKENIPSPDFDNLLVQAGSTLRPGAKDGSTSRRKVMARSYPLPQAVHRLGLAQKTIETAAVNGSIPSITIPPLSVRIPAFVIEEAISDEAKWEALAQWEEVRAQQIALVSDISIVDARDQLKAAGISSPRVFWGQVRGRWGLPSAYRDFQKILSGQLPKVPAHREKSQKRTPSVFFIGPTASVHQKKERSRRGYVHALRSRTVDHSLSPRQRTTLRSRLLEVFPTWNVGRRRAQQVHIHAGPTNSGKTYDALNDLIAAGSGWYLAPLRLLAFEIYDTLNARGVPCNLLTGEERITVPGAQITASTIEMYDPPRAPECIVIDEAQMLADSQRGWAWTRALMETPSPNIHVLCAPAAEELVGELVKEAGMSLVNIQHARLAPLEVASACWSLERLPSRTILIAFSRFLVLALKTELEKVHHRSVSVVYGNLPPEVRRIQAARFLAGESEICVATDAVGMGLNLPADYVCFFEVDKFDGRARRELSAMEIQQIGGRAGRFGLSQSGVVGALTKADLAVLRRAFAAPVQPLEFARVAPSPEALALIPGHLAIKLDEWQRLSSIPDQWRHLLQPMDLTEQISLAGTLTTEEIDQLGMETTLRLINAPTQKETRPYWSMCARAILEKAPMPWPTPIREIQTSQDLMRAEESIRSADIYRWLAYRQEFSQYGPDAEQISDLRREWCLMVDRALLVKIDTSRRCSQCGRKIPLHHRYGICESCHRSRGWKAGEY
jgi:hypothetical protein